MTEEEKKLQLQKIDKLNIIIFLLTVEIMVSIFILLVLLIK